MIKSGSIWINKDGDKLVRIVTSEYFKGVYYIDYREVGQIHRHYDPEEEFLKSYEFYKEI